MWIDLKPFPDQARCEALCEKAKRLEYRLIGLLQEESDRVSRGDGRISQAYWRRCRRICDLQNIRRWLNIWRYTVQGVPGLAWRPLA